MANSVYPPELPSLLVEGFSAEDQDNVDRFQPQYGPPIMRLGSSVEVELQTGAILLKGNALLAVFEDWYHDELDHGSLPFDWVDVKTGQPATFLFGTKPRKDARGVHWYVSFQLFRVPG